MVRDLLLSHPEPSNLHIIPTARDPTDELALSSRNAYLSTDGRKVAATLRQALKAAENAWAEGRTKRDAITAASNVIEERTSQAAKDGLNVTMKMDYVEMNDAHTFDVLEDEKSNQDAGLVILSGALYVDQTRLIDNILLGDAQRVLG